MSPPAGFMKKWTLKFKLYLPLTLTFLIFLAISLFGMISIHKVATNVSENNQLNTKINKISADMLKSLKAYELLMNSAWSKYTLYEKGKTNQEVANFEEMDNRLAEASAGIKMFADDVKDDKERASSVEQVLDIEKSINEAYQKFKSASVDLKVTKAEIGVLTQDLKSALSDFQIVAENVRFVLEDKSGSVSKELETTATVQKEKVISLMISGICIAVVFFVFVFLIIRNTVNSLQEITQMNHRAATQVSFASDELSNAAEKLSSTSQQQASALQETSASLTQIAGMAESNTKGAELADGTAQEVYKISEAARNSMDNLAVTMNSILESNVRIEELVKVIEEVGEKTQIIDDIVFKTQLLSFNASVEAERAGEHGRGFAVVAQEVGNLAQLSGKAALEISAIVKESIKVAESVSVENKTRVTNGGNLAKETKEKMGFAIERMNDILNEISKIVQASKEQGQGISQISTSVESVSQLTQESASTAEETATSSGQLSEQANNLMDAVKKLNSLVHGESKIEAQKPVQEMGREAPKVESENSELKTAQ